MHHTIVEGSALNFEELAATKSLTTVISEPINTENFRLAALIVRVSGLNVIGTGASIKVKIGAAWPDSTNRSRYWEELTGPSISGTLTLAIPITTPPSTVALQRTPQLEINAPAVQVVVEATQGSASGDALDCLISVGVELYD